MNIITKKSVEIFDTKAITVGGVYKFTIKPKDTNIPPKTINGIVTYVTEEHIHFVTDFTSCTCDSEFTNNAYIYGFLHKMEACLALDYNYILCDIRVCDYVENGEGELTIEPLN